MKQKQDADPFVLAESRPGLFSLLCAAGIFVVFSVLGYTILDRQLYANILLARNDAEQTMNNLFAVMRQEGFQGRHRFGIRGEFPDFGVILTEYPRLSEKIAGIGWYSAHGMILARYGDVPDASPGKPPEAEPYSYRNYSFDRKSETLRVVSSIPASRARGMRAKDLRFFFSPCGRKATG